MAEAPSSSCPSCDGTRVALGVRTDMEHHAIKLWRPTKRRWGRRDVTAVRAMACVGCGLVTFHAADLAGLRAEVAEARELFVWDD